MSAAAVSTPIYDQLVREWRAERAREAYAASPGVIGIGQWEDCGGVCCGGAGDYDRPRRVRPPRKKRHSAIFADAKKVDPMHGYQAEGANEE